MVRDLLHNHKSKMTIEFDFKFFVIIVLVVSSYASLIRVSRGGFKVVLYLMLSLVILYDFVSRYLLLRIFSGSDLDTSTAVRASALFSNITVLASCSILVLVILSKFASGTGVGVTRSQKK